MTQSICSSVSSARSRLVRVTEMASMALLAFLPGCEGCGPLRVTVPTVVRGGRWALLGEVLRAEGLGQHLRQRPDARRGLQQQVRAAELVQQLPAAAARDEDLAPAVHAGEVREPAASGALQLGDQSALGAQAESVAGVLHVAAGDGAPVVDEGGHADRVARVGDVRVGHRLAGEGAQGLPVGVRRGRGHLPCPFRYGMPFALGIRSRCADRASTTSVMTYGVAATTWLGTSFVPAYQA